jgi:hypothetical protein
MYSTKIAAGVWIGNHENTVVWCGQQGCMEGKTGPMLAEYMRSAHQGLAGSDARWQQPSGIKTVCIDRISGYAATTGGECDIFPSWYIARTPDSSQKAIIDTISNKLATECTPLAAQKEITGGGILPELPATDPYYSNWLAPVLARYAASVGGAIPTTNDDVHTCNAADLPQINIVEPISFDDTIDKYVIKANVTQGKYPLTTVNFKVNGTIISGGSLSVTASGETDAVYYEPVDAETFTVTAEVIDSVLYSNSSNPVDRTPTPGELVP